MNLIKRITDKLRRKPLLVKPVVTNCYFVNENEYKKMQELKSNTVKLTGGSGIGIGVECLVKGKWVDITDYNSW